MPDTTLILGGGGFLGTAIARELASRNVSLRLFDRHFPTLSQNISGDVEYVFGDVFDRGSLNAAMQGCSRVLYFLGGTVPSSSSLVRECEMTVRALSMVLDAMETHGVGMLFFPSSGGAIYGDSSKKRAHQESDGILPDGTYALGKQLCEDIIRFQARKTGLKYVIGRLSNPYGNHNPAIRPQGVIDVSLARILGGNDLELWGDGSQVRDFVFVDDMVAMIADLLECEERGLTVNVGSGQGISISEVMHVVAEVTGAELALVRNETVYSGVSHSVLDTTLLASLIGPRDLVELEPGVRLSWQRMCDMAACERNESSCG